MVWISIDVDDSALEVVMTRYRFATSGEAVNFALRRIADAPLPAGGASELRGSGWEGDLDILRGSRRI